jgi:hypothetical protein
MLEVNKKVYLEDGTLYLQHNPAYRMDVREMMTSLLSELSV